jgi:hypothetical protein
MGYIGNLYYEIRRDRRYTNKGIEKRMTVATVHLDVWRYVVTTQVDL